MMRMTTATFDTSEGTFKVKLYDDKAPNTVANFVGPRRGHQGMDRSEDRPEGEASLLRRPDLSPRHRRLHDPGRLPDGQRHGRSGLQVRRRVRPGPAPRQAGAAVDGQLRPEHQRQPVLHHARADAVARQQARDLRRGHRRQGRRREDRQDPHRRRRIGRPRTSRSIR